MTARLDWEREGAGWPNSAHSRFVTTGHLRWHVQQAGQGPRILLLHGTGASVHSWAGLLPRLAARHAVMAVDLPGHAFTTGAAGHDLTLEAMARALADLLRETKYAPDVLIGHSAGAAIALRLALLLEAAPTCTIALNGALLPLSGVAGIAGPALAKAFAASPAVARMFAGAARDPDRVARLIRSTGSVPCAPYLACYQRLFADPGHVRATLRMMAGWDVSGVLPAFARAGLPLVQIVASGDLAVPPATADTVARRYPEMKVCRLDGLGHLAHEEDPAMVASLIISLLSELGKSTRRRRARA